MLGWYFQQRAHSLGLVLRVAGRLMDQSTFAGEPSDLVWCACIAWATQGVVSATGQVTS